MRPFNNMHWYRYLLLISAPAFLPQCEEESMVHISDKYFLEALIDSDVYQEEDGEVYMDISIHSELKLLWIEDMPSLHEVCVWTLPFPPENLQFKSQNSPNVSYTMKCTP